MANWDLYDEMTAPADGDTFLNHDISETVVGQKMKKITWANIKATLKTYFDTLYLALVSPGTSGNVLTSDGTNWTSAAPTGGVDGWVPAGIVWTYASATTFTVSGDKSAVYTNGMKFKLTANSVVLQGYILSATYSSPNTTVTVLGNALTNHTFSLNYYSTASNPAGFTHVYAWTPTFTGLTVVGAESHAGHYWINGVTFHFRILADAEISIASTVNTTYCNNLPVTVAQSTVLGACNANIVASYESGLITSNRAFLPTISATRYVLISGSAPI